ncbi:hypothetical protein HKX48_008078, partial [Thoreauomyces humboldtii]
MVNFVVTDRMRKVAAPLLLLPQPSSTTTSSPSIQEGHEHLLSESIRLNLRSLLLEDDRLQRPPSPAQDVAPSTSPPSPTGPRQQQQQQQPPPPPPPSPPPPPTLISHTLLHALSKALLAVVE